MLQQQVSPLTEDAAFGGLAGTKEKVRRYGDFRYAAGSWNVRAPRHRRVEAGGEDQTGASSSPEPGVCPDGLQEGLLRAQAGRRRPDQGAPRTASGFRPCLLHEATAKRIQLLLGAAAYWLMLDLRNCFRLLRGPPITRMPDSIRSASA